MQLARWLARPAATTSRRRCAERGQRLRRGGENRVDHLVAVLLGPVRLRPRETDVRSPLASTRPRRSSTTARLACVPWSIARTSASIPACALRSVRATMRVKISGKLRAPPATSLRIVYAVVKRAFAHPAPPRQRAERGAIEAVVTVEACAGKAAVLGVEIGDAKARCVERRLAHNGVGDGTRPLDLGGIVVPRGGARVEIADRVRRWGSRGRHDVSRAGVGSAAATARVPRVVGSSAPTCAADAMPKTRSQSAAHLIGRRGAAELGQAQRLVSELRATTCCRDRPWARRRAPRTSVRPSSRRDLADPALRIGGLDLGVVHHAHALAESARRADRGNARRIRQTRAAAMRDQREHRAHREFRLVHRRGSTTGPSTSIAA